MWFEVVVTFVQMIRVFYFSTEEKFAYDLTAFVAVIGKLLPIKSCAINARIMLLVWSFFIIL